MTSTNLYIPDLLKVGFVKRTDTYLQTLAYVTYIAQPKSKLSEALQEFMILVELQKQLCI
jgi:hypothetical protein